MKWFVITLFAFVILLQLVHNICDLFDARAHQKKATPQPKISKNKPDELCQN